MNLKFKESRVKHSPIILLKEDEEMLNIRQLMYAQFATPYRHLNSIMLGPPNLLINMVSVKIGIDLFNMICALTLFIIKLLYTI